MARNAIPKVLDVERTLEPRSEETAKRRDQRGEARHDEEVELIWRVRDRGDLPSELSDRHEEGHFRAVPRLSMMNLQHLKGWPLLAAKSPTPSRRIRDSGRRKLSSTR